MKSWAKGLTEDVWQSDSYQPQENWKYKLFPVCFPRNMKSLQIHVSKLETESIPHDPHSHIEEEIIIALRGNIEIIKSDNKNNFNSLGTIEPGSFAYHNSLASHTLKNIGEQAASYICIKWKDKKVRKNDYLKSSIYRPNYSLCDDENDQNFQTKVVFETHTEFVDRLQCHVSNLTSGAGYPAHSDPHDVVIILLKGSVETLAEKVNSPAAIFYRAGEKHAMKHISGKSSEYLVFEFYNKDILLKLFRLRRVRSVIRKILNSV